MRERKVKDKEEDLIKTLSRVGPRNIVRVNLSAHFRWPELRELEREGGMDGPDPGEKEGK